MKRAVLAWAAVWAGFAVWAEVPKDDATDRDIASRVRDIDGDGVIRVACVGDSITAGTPQFNYPKYLSECLDALGKRDGRKYAVRNHGKGAAAVRHVREKVDVNGDGVNDDYFYYDDPSYRSSLTYTPDVVIIQMGTNDSLFDNWANWGNYFDKDYETYLVKPFRDKGSLIVISTPPYAQNGWHDQNVNGPVHDRVVSLARKLGLPVVDTNRLLWGQPEILADGLHGNLTGYTLMAQNFYKHIFGGDLYTVSFTGEPQARITLRDERTKRAYSRVLDKDGKGTLTFLPDAYVFHLVAEKPAFKREVRTIAAFQTGSEQEVAVALRPGDFNYALRGKPIQCDAKVYAGRLDCATLNDGKRTTDGYQPDRWHAGDWCGIALDETAPIHSVVIYWETAEFVSTYQDGGYDVFLLVKDEWRDVAAVGVAGVGREAYSGAVVADTLTFKAPVEVSGVKVVFKEGRCSHRFAPKVYEIELLSDAKPPRRNPLFDGWYADPQIRRYGDTYWIFPTYSHAYSEQLFIDVFSSKDLKTWTKHPRAVDAKDFSWVRGCMWAPDAHEKDGKYYIFFGANDAYPIDRRGGNMTPRTTPGIGQYGGIGVAVADRPEGPYKDLIGKPLIDQFWNAAQPIDQYVFTYKGDWYMVYGGWGRCNLVKLAPDFKSLVPFEDGRIWRDMTPKNYVEGSVMFERKGKWYFMYSSGAWTTSSYCVNYSVGDSPFGPFEFKGQVLASQRPIATGAGHHSVINVPGTDDWYICYHRRPIPNKSGHHRVTCLDRMYFDANGNIRPIVMTE